MPSLSATSIITTEVKFKRVDVADEDKQPQDNQNNDGKPIETAPPENQAASETPPPEAETLASAEESDALEKPPEQPQTQTARPEEPIKATGSIKEKAVRRFSRINPYLVLFILIVIVAALIAFISNRINEQSDPANLTFEGSQLDQETINELLKSEQNVGTVDQTLTVEANAIFNGKVLIKSDLDVAGTIRSGGPLSISGITVAGTSQFDDVDVGGDLAVLGSASIQQSLSVQGAVDISNNLSVGGTISAGAISADSIEFNGNLNLSRHINTGGSTPTKANGPGLGSGGTASVSGNDIAGTVTINAGSGAPAGFFVRINFANTYNSTPAVIITPANSNAGSLEYYTQRDSSGFRIGTANDPPDSRTYIFDYFVIE